MRVLIALQVDDPADEDPHAASGLTSDAYQRLVGAVVGAGFSIEEGPTRGITE